MNLPQRFFYLTRVGAVVLLLAGGASLLAAPAAAQFPLAIAGKKSASPEPVATNVDSADRQSADDLRKRQLEIVDEIAAFETGTVPDGISKDERARRLRTLTFIGFSYQNHLNALVTLAENRRVSVAAEQNRIEWNGFAEPPPYSIIMVDQLSSEHQRRTLLQQTADAQVKIIETRIQTARNGLAKAREDMRLRQEKAERASASKADAQSWRLAQARLEERAAVALLSSLLAAREAAQAEQDEAGKSARFAEKQLQLAQAQVVFSAGDLASLQARIEARLALAVATLEKTNAELSARTKEVDAAGKRLDSARATLATLQRELAPLNAKLQGAQAEVERAKQSAGVLDKINPFSGSAARNEIKKLQQQVSTLEAKLKVARGEVTRLDRESVLTAAQHRNATIASDFDNNRIALLEVERTFWEIRYAAHQAGPDATDKRRTLTERSREMLVTLGPRAALLRNELDATVEQILFEQEAIKNRDDASDGAFHTRMLALLTAREHTYRQSVSEIADLSQVLQRLVAEDAARTASMSPVQRMALWWDVARSSGLTVWRFELFTVEDTIEIEGRKITGSRGITVGKVLQSIFLVVIGYVVISLLARAFLSIATRRQKIDSMEAQIAHKWIMTAATVILALMAMELLKIPLAAFAFLGGAIAIGFGFGMQTLLKNLISGLMLLLERPFKIRDVVEVGGIRGEITGINIRSCTIRSVTGIETLVPNSTFLEQNVTNWTLSSKLVRYTVAVGVAYGAAVDEVARLLREIADQHPGVQHDPLPEVIFQDFGDNALMFELNVWLNIGQNSIASRVVLSELRFMISRSFAEHGISIPYPQRDVHLDTSSPLSVRMVRDGPATEVP